ncbi:MAG: biopolymer transporter ExbD [Oligoflexia bacterium]|nr:biopolymer transporter ExbD [Oligoflexia bacterium]
MNAKLERILREGQTGTFPLNITSMIDMLTIILVFLLKSYASSSVDITPSKALSLPTSTAQEAPVEALKLMVTAEGIFVDDKEVLNTKERKVASNEAYIKPLYDALVMQAQKTKEIATRNETIEFDGKIVMQADQNLNYAYLKKVMYTAALAGYSDFKFAVISH